MSDLADLRRRNVIRIAGLYLVGAWLVVQVAETLVPAFDVPGWGKMGMWGIDVPPIWVCREGGSPPAG